MAEEFIIIHVILDLKHHDIIVIFNLPDLNLFILYIIVRFCLSPYAFSTIVFLLGFVGEDLANNLLFLMLMRLAEEAKH